MVKKGNQAYLDKDWTTLRSLYADTAKIADNTWGDSLYISPDQYQKNSLPLKAKIFGYGINQALAKL